MPKTASGLAVFTVIGATGQAHTLNNSACGLCRPEPAVEAITMKIDEKTAKRLSDRADELMRVAEEGRKDELIKTVNNIYLEGVIEGLHELNRRVGRTNED